MTLWMLNSVVSVLALSVQVASTALAQRAVTVLSTAQVAAFTPYSWYAATAYCPPVRTLAWSCGRNCNANPSFRPVASGGDGGDLQYWYVGYDPSLKTVIVGHQGTDASKIVSLLTDADLFFDNFDSALFPGVSSLIQGHNGFLDQHAKTATIVLAAVKTAMSTYAATSVTMVGHSLGGALALIDAVYLPLHLPSTTTFKTFVYGMPRVGNQAFADYVDSHVTGLTHVNNERDMVPIVPGRGLGYHHPSGEVHIQSSGVWAACSGQDNTNSACTIGTVPNIFAGNLLDHPGPYNGVYLGC